jgi:hypothetical protein
MIASSLQLNAQTTVIIDSFGITTPINGGFENLTATPAANGWTTVNNGTNNWYVGALSNCVGLKGAYIGNGSALNNNYKNTLTTVSHLYAPVTFPAGQTCITLSFTYKGQGETNADGLQVYLGSAAPQSNKDLTTTDATAIQLGASWYNMVGTTCTRVSITIPASYAGTTKNLVFSWKNNSSSGSNNAATLDNVSLVSTSPSLPNCPTLNTPANNATGQTTCNPVLNWNASVVTGCNAVSTYYVYFGTTTNPPLVDSTSSTSYVLGSLTASTKYYWRIVPRNSAGLNLTCNTEYNFTTSSTSCGAGPGGAVSNMQVWLKADANITVSGGSVPRWNNNVSGSAAGDFAPANTYFASPTQTAPTYTTSQYNYNPAVNFDGNTQSLTSTNYFFGRSMLDQYNNTVFQVFYHYGSGTVWFKWETDNAGTHRIGFERNGTYVRSDFPTTTGSAGINKLSTVNIANNLNLLTFTSDNTYNTNRLQGVNPAALDISGTGGFTDGGLKGYMSLGNNATSNLPTRIDMSEIIVYNRKLSPLELNKVESYLAIKHGITLGTNYTASNGSNIYTNTAPYNLNVIGIGRDDAEALLQKQSHQQDDTVRIYKGALSWYNAGNSSSFAADGSYIVIGSNAGMLGSTAASKAETPVTCFIYSRMEREWKVSNRNFAEKFNMDIKLSLAANPGAVNPNNLRLLVDDDGNFANGGTTCYYNGDGTGIVISYSNPVITVSGISNTHIPLNGTKYITLGSGDPITPLPVELLNFNALCQSNKIMVNWSTASEINNQDFELQRSEDGAAFNNIALIKGQVNSNTVHNYQYNDMNVGAPIIYYRLKQTDVNGQVHYSNVIKVNSCNPGHYNNYINFYPNPVTGSTLNIKYSVKANEEIGIKLYDVTGRIMLQQSLSLKQGSADTKLNLPNLTKGVYFIQFASTQVESIPQKLIKE